MTVEFRRMNYQSILVCSCISFSQAAAKALVKTVRRSISDIVKFLDTSAHIFAKFSLASGYERDEREPGFETLEAIADFFNVNMDYLLGREPNA